MKILVISLAGIGDTLLATPLIHELRANFPDDTLDALVLWRGAKDLLAHNPHLDRVHQQDLMRGPKTASLRFLWSLRKEKYDVSINTHPQSRMHYRIAARIIGAPIRISHRYECFGVWDRWLVNRTLPQSYEEHSVENNLRLLPLLGAGPRLGTHAMEVYPTAADEDWAAAFLTDRGLSAPMKLGIHTGSGGTKNLALKRWPLAHYVELVQRLNRERPDVSVLLFGGPEEESDHATILARADPRRVVRAETKNLDQAAALLRRCDAFLSVDTALMHLAAAVKVRRQIVIEAPTLNRTNLPYGHAFTLVKNPAVAGRNLDYYRYDGRGIRGTREALLRCMASVTPEAVWQAVEAALNDA